METKAKDTMAPELLARLREQVRSNPQTVTEVIDQIKAPDAAELLNELSLEDAAMIVTMLPLAEAVAIFNEPSFERRHEILKALDLERASKIIVEMFSDERVDVIHRLDAEHREKLMPLLPEKIASEIKMLLQFPPTTAGGNMSTEFVRLDPDTSVAEALNHIKAVAKRRSHIYSAYVLDGQDRLQKPSKK